MTIVLIIARNRDFGPEGWLLMAILGWAVAFVLIHRGIMGMVALRRIPDRRQRLQSLATLAGGLVLGALLIYFRVPSSEMIRRAL